MKKSKSGFTLVELLIVITIMMIIGIIFTNILIESLRGRSKVNAINQVKQNGQVVLDKLSNEIRGAESLICVSRDIIVIFKDGKYTLFKFFPPSSSTNGYLQRIDFSNQEMKDNFDSLSPCDTYPLPFVLTSLNQTLTDTDPQRGVSITGISGQPIFEPGANDESMTIKFAASAGVKAGFAYDATVKDGGIPFMTSVQIRGAKR